MPSGFGEPAGSEAKRCTLPRSHAAASSGRRRTDKSNADARRRTDIGPLPCEARELRASLILLPGGDEVYLPALEVDAHQLHRHSVSKTKALAAALAEQLVAVGVELEVIAAELGDVHQAVDEVVVEGDE